MAELNDEWARSRIDIGSRWAWLLNKITDLNKQIYLLDHHVEGLGANDRCLFDTSSVFPRFFPLANRSATDKLRGVSNGAIGGLVALGKASGMKKHNNNNNGFSQLSPLGHAQYLPHLLLPESLLGTKLQVKDLLAPTPLGHNLLCLEEAHSSSARTR